MGKEGVGGGVEVGRGGRASRGRTWGRRVWGRA